MLPKSSFKIDRASSVCLLLLSVVVVVLLSWGRWRDGEVASVHHIIVYRASCVSLWLLLLLLSVVVVLLSWGRWRDGEVASVHHIIDVTLARHGTLPPEPCLAVAMGHNCCARVEFFMMLP